MNDLVVHLRLVLEQRQRIRRQLLRLTSADMCQAKFMHQTHQINYSLHIQAMVRTTHGRVRMTEDRDKWRKYVHGMANPQTEDG